MAATTATSSELIGDAFRAAFRGELIEPGDARYDEARAVYNGMIDRRPRLIAPVADTTDVIAAVGLAREAGLPLAIREGGHNAGGLGVFDDAIVVDLSAKRAVHVDPANIPRLAFVIDAARRGEPDHRRDGGHRPRPRQPLRCIAASNAISDGGKSQRRTLASASRAPCIRSMPESSHSIDSGPS
jgi:hypothetical protein